MSGAEGVGLRERDVEIALRPGDFDMLRALGEGLGSQYLDAGPARDRLRKSGMIRKLDSKIFQRGGGHRSKWVITDAGRAWLSTRPCDRPERGGGVAG